MTTYQKHKLLMKYYKPAQIDQVHTIGEIDILKQNHQFIRNGNDLLWEERVAKKYYEKLFREYCLADLSKYRKGQIAMRWRVGEEVVIGKGQFECGSIHCNSKENLHSWEVNFAYVEQDKKKNALVKLRLCPDCSVKLNYRKIKELKKHKPSMDDDARLQRKKRTISEVSSQDKRIKRDQPYQRVEEEEEDDEEYFRDLLN